MRQLLIDLRSGKRILLEGIPADSDFSMEESPDGAHILFSFRGDNRDFGECSYFPGICARLFGGSAYFPDFCKKVFTFPILSCMINANRVGDLA